MIFPSFERKFYLNIVAGACEMSHAKAMQFYF